MMMRTERGAAQHTLDAYATDLSLCADHIPDLHKASYMDLQDYLASCTVSARTLARKISTLKQFYNFLLSENWINSDPARHLPPPRKQRKLPRVLSQEEVAKLLAHAAQDSSYQGLRLYTLLELIYGTGLRVSELISLRTDSILPDENALIIQGKGNKERLVPFHAHAKQAIEAYLAVRPNTDTPWIFPSYGAQGHITRHRVSQCLKDLAIAVNIPPERISPHVLRHSFASHMLDNGIDLLSLQRLLGHEDIATTQIYTHVLEGTLHKFLYNYHPLSQEIKE